MMGLARAARAAVLCGLACGVWGAPAWARVVPVSDSAGLVRAIHDAKDGDDIVLADGVYAVGRKIVADAPGGAQTPITVRARNRLKAEIRSTAVIAFEVTAPHWIFRDLVIRGTCRSDSDCDHAFHVVGDTTGFQMSGNRISDFNAHLKVNADGAHVMPADGLIEGNSFFDTRPRHTELTVALLNIDSTTGWVVRGNAIYDFARDGGDGVSYGAYVKGGSIDPIIEGNLVIGARALPRNGASVGLSFGGGGTGGSFCAPRWNADETCDPEVTGGIMRNNIVVNTTDVGIYLNSATDSKILFNTLVRTRGIEFRFSGSSGEARGNLMSSTIRSRDGGQFSDGGNAVNLLSTAELEAWYADPDAGDLSLKAPPVRALGKGGDDPRVTRDFCGRVRTAPLDLGALQSSLGDCKTLP